MAISDDRRSVEPSLAHVAIAGVQIADIAGAEVRNECLRRIDSASGGKIATANLDFLALARRDPNLQRYLATSTMVVADGMPVVWLARLAGAKHVQRLAGVDLVRELCAAGKRVAIYGSTARIAGSAAGVLASLNPQTEIVHLSTPPFRALSETEKTRDRDALVEARPDIVLVALGCPAQERLISEWYPALPSALWIGVGGTLDFFAGMRRRAPRWAQRFGLEWMFRMAQEPRRLGPRYLRRDLPVLAALAPRCALARFART